MTASPPILALLYIPRSRSRSRSDILYLCPPVHGRAQCPAVAPSLTNGRKCGVKKGSRGVGTV